MRKGLELSFEGHYLTCFLICDRPSHGYQYHKRIQLSYDRLAFRIPKDKLENELLKYVEKKKNFSFSCLELDKSHTEIMFRKMKDVYSELII